MPQLTKILCVTAIAFTLLISACKESSIIETSDIPVVDNINTFYTDTTTIIANNIVRDSFQTGGLDLKQRFLAYYPALGCINADPAFGSTVSSIAFQVVPPKNVLKFPTIGTITTDSLILSMPYRSVYGDTSASATQTFNVYQLADTLKGNSRLYNTDIVTINPTLLGSTTVNFAKLDSIFIGGVKKEPQIRIALSMDFANKLLGLTDTVEYKNAAAFKAWIKGLYITPADTNVGKSIGHLFMPGVTMTYYFRNTIGTKIDTTQFVFKYDDAVCTHYNSITRNFAKAAPNNIATYLNTNNPNGDAKLYTQGDFGSTIRIKLPHLYKMPNAIINKAEIELTVIPSGYPMADSMFKPCKRLFPYVVNAVGSENTFYNNDSPNIRDNDLSTVYENGVLKRRYLINISSLIQRTITAKDSTLLLNIRGFNTVSERTILQGDGRITLGGNTNGTEKIKLHLIYTKLK